MDIFQRYHLRYRSFQKLRNEEDNLQICLFVLLSSALQQFPAKRHSVSAIITTQQPTFNVFIFFLLISQWQVTIGQWMVLWREETGAGMFLSIAPLVTSWLPLHCSAIEERKVYRWQSLYETCILITMYHLHPYNIMSKLFRLATNTVVTYVIPVN